MANSPALSNAAKQVVIAGMGIIVLTVASVGPRSGAQSTPTPTPTPKVAGHPQSPPRSRPTPTPRVALHPQPTPRPTPSTKIAGRPTPTPTPHPSAGAGRVTRAQLTATAPGKSGQCPAQENFSGAVTASGAATVTYTWVSFDGGTWPQGTLHFAGAGTQRVSEQVRMGAAGQVIHGWMQLKVLSPNAVLSPRAQYTINCGGGQGAGRVTRAQVTVTNNLPKNVAARCPIQEDFNGTITTNGTAQVTYTWTSSDNSTWPQGTLRFAGSGTQTVRETWTLGGAGQNVNAWVRLKILSPNAYTSNPAAFSFKCP